MIYPERRGKRRPEILDRKPGGYALSPGPAPGMEDERLRRVVSLADGYIYSTLRVGITGARKEIDGRSLKFLEML